MESLRILLVDDHKIVREGLRLLLDQQAHDWQVVGEASGGRSAIALAGTLRPDVVIMDVSMPGLNGVEATRRIVQAQPAARVIALSMHVEPSYVATMLAAGARGYVNKEAAFDEIVAAIRAVSRNQLFLGEGIEPKEGL
ncbi:MAG: response regulator transcription factor [Gammaproteobacteria bacterium]